jgi:hypothetical protein
MLRQGIGEDAWQLADDIYEPQCIQKDEACT